VEGAAVIHIRQEFTSDPDQLAELRAVVGAACRQAWADEAPDDTVQRVQLAVQEAATNILRHAYQGDSAGPIRAELTADSDRLTLTLTHDGADFDPTAVPPPAFDGTRAGGFGVYLIHQCMDHVCYVHGEPGRRGVTMVKHRAAPVGEKPMNLVVETFGDVMMITLNAEQLEVGNADDMRLALDQAIGDAKKVALDLGRVEFVDSRGCGVILSCLKHLAERSGDLKLCRVNKPVRTVFDLIRLHKMCEITDTRDQAIQAFR
jgi:serine/threonine-protein kinase RsbW